MVRMVGVVGLRSHILSSAGAYGEAYESPDPQEIARQRELLAEAKERVEQVQRWIDRLERSQTGKNKRKSEKRRKKST